MTKKVAYILTTLLLLSGAGLLLDCERARAQGSPPRVPGRTVFSATLEKAIDVKKLKVGNTFTASGADWSLPPSSPFTFVGRVLKASQIGKGNKNSLLIIRFEKVILDNKQEVQTDLELRAIADSRAVTWSGNVIITDRYGCDYQTDPIGCEEKQKDPHLEDRLTRTVCENNPKKGTAPPGPKCVPLPAASGLYGFPDFSMSPPDTGRDYVITSKTKNIHFEAGTYFVLSGPAPLTINKPEP